MTLIVVDERDFISKTMEIFIKENKPIQIKSM